MSLWICLCSKPLRIDSRKKMICFGSDDNCITVKTKKQFEIVFEVIMKTVEYCKNCMYEVEEMAKKVYKEGRV